MPRRIPAMPGTPDSTLPGLSSQHHHACPFAPVISCRSSSAVPPAPPGRRSYAQGRWSVAPAPVTGWTDCDRGPQADAEERIRSAHRAIEIREKRRRVLSSRPADYALPVDGEFAAAERHGTAGSGAACPALSFSCTSVALPTAPPARSQVHARGGHTEYGNDRRPPAGLLCRRDFALRGTPPGVGTGPAMTVTPIM